MKRILPIVLFLIVIGCGGTDATTPSGIGGSGPAVSSRGNAVNSGTERNAAGAAASTDLRPRTASTRPLFAIVGAAALASYAGLCFVRVMNEDPPRLR